MTQPECVRGLSLISLGAEILQNKKFFKNDTHCNLTFKNILCMNMKGTIKNLQLYKETHYNSAQLRLESHDF